MKCAHCEEDDPDPDGIEHLCDGKIHRGLRELEKEGKISVEKWPAYKGDTLHIKKLYKH